MSNIRLKTDLTTIKNLRESGKRLFDVLNKIAKEAKPGVSLLELDNLAYQLITQSQKGKRDNDKPAILNYKPKGAPYSYPATLCLSVNDQVAHGIPDNYILKDGDILSIDTCINHKGMITDSAITIGIGNIKKEDQDLISITKKALNEGIKVAKVGNYINDISKTIENYIKKEGQKMGYNFGILKVLAGHGVGYKVHEEPLIPNFDDGVKGVKLVEGMVLAIEPMVNLGTDEVFLDEDGYCFRTCDKKNSAHFEHTILITKNNPEILTIN